MRKLYVTRCLLVILVIGTSTTVVESACLDSAAPAPVADPERDLIKVERLSQSLVELGKKQICGAIERFDTPAVRSRLSDEGRFERLFPLRRQVSFESLVGTGSELAPERRGCFAGADAFIADLERLTDAWMRVDRCQIKPQRIFATKTSPRRAVVDLRVHLAGMTVDGGRVSEHLELATEVMGDPSTGWQLTRAEVAGWQRFQAPQPSFVDATAEVGLPIDWPDVGYDTDDIAHGQVLYGGVSVGDYDGDGWSDLYISRAGANLLLRNDAGRRFIDVTAAAGVGDPGNSQAAIWGDFDNDGDADLFIVNAHYSLVGGAESARGHVIYRNDCGRFVAVGEPLGPIGPASGAAAADYDGDGLLDIYVIYYQDKNLNPYHHYIEARDGLANRLYRNVGELRFTDATDDAGVGGSGWSYGAAWADYNGDGRIDLYVANDYGDNLLYRNLGDGRFVDVASTAGVVDAANGMSSEWGDYDNDGHLDLFISNMYSKTGNQFLPLYDGLEERVMAKLRFSAEGSSLYRNLGDGTFEETGRKLGANFTGWAWGGNFFDFDNDGWLDLHVANGFWAGKIDADA